MAGTSKLLARYGDGTVIHRVARTALARGLDPVVVVVGHEAEKVRSALHGLAVEFVEVGSEREGRLFSAVTGLEAVGRASCAVVLLGDEPGVRREHIRAVVDAARAAPGMTLRARYLDRPGHPVVIPARVIRSLSALARDQAGDASLWELMVRSGLPHGCVPVDAPGPIDIDTRADLESARARERAGGTTQSTGFRP
jgi:molybdenum cofactor cytidylyltransferase